MDSDVYIAKFVHNETSREITRYAIVRSLDLSSSTIRWSTALRWALSLEERMGGSGADWILVSVEHLLGYQATLEIAEDFEQASPQT